MHIKAQKFFTHTKSHRCSSIMTLQQIMNNDEQFYKQKTDSEAMSQFPNILKIQDILKSNLQDSPSKDFIQRAANILSNIEKANVDLTLYKESLSNQIRNSIQDYLKRATGSQSPVKISGEIKVSVDETNASPINLSFKDSNEQQSVVNKTIPIETTTTTITESFQQTQQNSQMKITVSPNKSKRKSSNPVKVPIIIETETNEKLAHDSLDPSQPNSPSGDSGVLDLSRSNSVTGSAPITPKKDEFSDTQLFNKTSSPILNQFNTNPLFEYIQKHFLNQSARNNTTPNIPFPTGDGRGDFFLPNNTSVTTTAMPYILPKPKDFLGASETSRLGSLGSPLKGHQKKAVSMRNTNRVHNPVQRRSNASRKFPCNQCRQEFTSLHSLEEHTISIHGSYRCHICQAQFTQRSNLQRHALKHVGFKPFECTVCKKAYYRKDHLIRHMEIGHPGYDPRTNIKVHLTSSESLEFLNRAAVFANNIQSQIAQSGSQQHQQQRPAVETANLSPPQNFIDDYSMHDNLIIDESQSGSFHGNENGSSTTDNNSPAHAKQTVTYEDVHVSSPHLHDDLGESSSQTSGEMMHWTSSINEQFSKSNQDLKV